MEKAALLVPCSTETLGLVLGVAPSDRHFGHRSAVRHFDLVVPCALSVVSKLVGWIVPMGFCLSKCLPDSDMAAELEAELDESRHSYVPQTTEQSTFGTTSLLAVRIVDAFWQSLELVSCLEAC